MTPKIKKLEDLQQRFIKKHRWDIFHCWTKASEINRRLSRKISRLRNEEIAQLIEEKCVTDGLGAIYTPLEGNK